MMKWCRSCVLPDTRPNLALDETGQCNACRLHASKGAVDWSSRYEHLVVLIDQVKERNALYDCVIPVSGGKDSTWQTLTCLDLGLRPLAVTWRPPGRTRLGQENLDNLTSLGVDHIDYSIDPRVEREFCWKTLVKAGSPALPMHFAIFSIPMRVATALRIPLVVWGENSAAEYGAASSSHLGANMTSDWLRHYGVNMGTEVAAWADEHLPLNRLSAYIPPPQDAIDAAQVQAIFLGHFLPWDPVRTAEAARAAGFRSRDSGPRTGVYGFADIDDEHIAVHHWMKWFKFGFTRSFDNLSLEIRNGRMTRDEAIGILTSEGIRVPTQDIESFCSFVRRSKNEFDAVCEAWRSPDIWSRMVDGRWTLNGFLIPGIDLP